MNRPDKAGEPSMEEILASIRQIIADEPSPDSTEPAIAANPLVPSSQAPKPAEMRVPLADRLSDVLKNGSLPPTSPLGSKRPLSFDQDLADMFDEEVPVNGGSHSAPKPDIRVSAALSHPMSGKPFVPPVAELQDDGNAVQEHSAKPAVVAAGAAAMPPQLAPSEPLVPPPRPGETEKPAEVAPQPTFGFPPLRKTSFYPPQPKAPVASKPASSNFLPSQQVSPGPEADALPGEAMPASDPAAVSNASGPSSASGESANGAFPSDPVRAPSEPHGLGSAPAFQDLPRHGETPFPSFAAAAPPPAEPVSPVLGNPVEPSFGSAPPGSPFRTSPLESRPVEPRSYADPFAQTAHPSPGHTTQPRFGVEPRMSADAAHQALDALAQGLAASAASSISPEAASPAIPLTPVFEASEPDLRPHVAAPSTLPVAVASPGSIPVTRTLEDAVADMLRPMLQQWVAENMPRIIERALRTEVAQSVKPGNKPPGT